MMFSLQHPLCKNHLPGYQVKDCQQVTISEQNNQDTCNLHVNTELVLLDAAVVQYGTTSNRKGIIFLGYS